MPKSPPTLRAALAVALVLAAGAAEAKTCASPAEEAALRSRVVQSQLMVAALSCDARSQYNAFVKKFERQLVVQGRQLKGFFQRTYGGGGEQRLNKFVTSMANEASQRSMAMGTEFCGAASGLFAELGQIQPADFSAFIDRQQFAGVHGVEACPAQAGLASSQ